MPLELSALTNLDTLSYSLPSDVPNKGNVIPIKLSASEVNSNNVISITLTSVYANTNFSLINLTPSTPLAPSLISGITDSLGNAIVNISLNPLGISASANIQAVINNQYSNTVTINYSIGTSNFLVNTVEGSPSTFLGINKDILDSILNTIRDIVDLLKFDDVGHKGLGTTNPEEESVASQEEELAKTILLASTETAKSVGGWFSNVYLKTVTNPIANSEYLTAQVTTTAQAAIDLTATVKSSPSTDLARSLLRYRSVAEWGAKTAQAVLDSLNMEYGSGNEVKNVSGLHNVNANRMYYTSNTTGHLDFPSFIQTSKLALQQSNLHQFQSDLFQISAGDIWERAEDLYHVLSGNTLRENFTSLKEVSRNAELIAGGMTIYGDTLYLQAGQPSLTPLMPDNPDPLIYPGEVGNFFMNVVNGIYQKANLGVFS
jgi:hypothetical protein